MTETMTTGMPFRCQPGSHIFTNMASCQCGQVRVNPTAPGATTMNVRITPTLLLPENDDARMLHELANALLVHQIEPFTPHRYPDFLRSLAERLSKPKPAADVRE